MRTHHFLLPTQILLLICVLQLLPGNARGEIWRSQELNCEIDLPSGSSWIPLPLTVPILKVAMKNQAEDKTILLFIGDAPQNYKTLSSFLPGFKQSWFKDGIFTDRSEETLTVDGRLASRLKDTITAQGTVIHRVNTIIIDSGIVYEILVTSRTENPLDDLEIGKTINSFHFLNNGSAFSVKSSTKTPADRLPELIGSITFYLLVGIVAIFFGYQGGHTKKMSFATSK